MNKEQKRCVTCVYGKSVIESISSGCSYVNRLKSYGAL